MAAPPICNPVLDHPYPIPGGVYPSLVIRVKGSVPAGSQRFAINLQCGPKKYPGEDIAFHFNPRFNQNCVVRNHMDVTGSHSWGVEETDGGLPLRHGDYFDIVLRCEQQFFEVSVNGKYFCRFFHRKPFRSITHIFVDGSVNPSVISFESTGGSCCAPPPTCSVCGCPQDCCCCC